MRIMPVCIYCYTKEKEGKFTEAQALEYVHQVSALTHNHLRSKMACGICYFLCKAVLSEKGSLNRKLQKGMDAAKAFYTSDIRNLTEWARFGRLESIAEFRKCPEEKIKSSGYVLDSLQWYA